MIHFFPTFSKAAGDSPFGYQLRQLGIPHRIFAGEVRLRYKRRLLLYVVGFPRLAWFAVKSALHSLAFSQPKPDAVVLGSDIEIVVFSLIKLVLRNASTKIIFIGFIFTPRESRLQNWFRTAYYRAVLRRTACVICQSQLESERYAELFASSCTRFQCIPWGTDVARRNEFLAEARDERLSPDQSFVLSAGRSGRDYQTLIRAFEDLPYKLHVICDDLGAMNEARKSSNITFFRHCYDEEYIRQLCLAQFIVIPLAVDDISAGQMVLIQAMALGKAIVVTRTLTICEYVEDRKEALLVERGSVEELRRAILTLANDAELRAYLGANAAAAYEEKYSTAAYMKKLEETIRLCAPAALKGRGSAP